MEKENLQNLIDACEQEPIHVPGSIQPFGATLAYTSYFGKLCQASENAGEFLSVDNIWETSLHTLFNGDVVNRMQEALLLNETFSGAANGIAYIAYVSAPYWIIEVEKYTAFEDTLSVRHLLKQSFNALRQHNESIDLLNELARQVRRISGFERVMVYKFDDEWHGQVLAEDCGQALNSMLDHHFPASDIPVQAREMYKKSPFRLIASTTATPVPMQLAADSPISEPVDMSFGTLRAVSPVHIQFLQNLGVAASCSIGIFCEQKLWGLVACHHIENIRLHPKKREALTLITEFFAQRHSYVQSQAVHNFQKCIYSLRENITRHFTIPTASIMQQQSDNWMKFLNACGCVFEWQGGRTANGRFPSEQGIASIIDWLDKNTQGESTWSTRNLQNEMDGSLDKSDAHFAGVAAMSMPVKTGGRAWLLFFRPEAVEVRHWAGKPEKLVYKGTTGEMLGPRKSFAMWQQRVEGCSLPWSEAELNAARDIARDLFILAHSSQ